MNGRTKVISPFLHQPLAIVLYSLPCLFPYPGDPCSAVSSKRYLPCRFERLKELIGLEEGLDAQCIKDPECEQKQQYVLRNRHLFDPFYGESLEPFVVIEVDGTVEAKFG